MNNDHQVIISRRPLGFPWQTQDPFLFCVYHADAYPRGNENFGPDESLEGRNLGNDFILKNGWRMYHGTKVPGFPVHPHRGFETVTVVRKGVVDHSDSMGGAGRYGHGDVQWMTAGKGIQHSEMFPLLNRDRDNPLELFQIWLNLPGAKKMVRPYYTMIWGEKIPVLRTDNESGGGARVEIIAGSFNGMAPPDPAPDSWAADPGNEVSIWVIEMQAGALLHLPPASEGIHRSLYFFEGEMIIINGDQISGHCAMDMKPHKDTRLECGPGGGRILMLQGRPINEPVANYGPFVMNTKSEIQQTYIDYRQTRFGGWPWPRPDQVHDRDRGRFARYADGSEEYPG
jgi:redox-sensitive bicupin YhaK (pirin superfamily)